MGDGETFAPYDPELPSVADFARSRGYVFPDDQEFQEKAFGLGWYKYAPEVATKLLEKNGFSRMPMANGCCPMVPLEISYMTGTVLSDHDARNAVAAVQQWKKFGIDATVFVRKAALI